MNDIQFTIAVRDLLLHRMSKKYTNTPKLEVHHLCTVSYDVLDIYQERNNIRECYHNMVGWIKTIGEELANAHANDPDKTQYYDFHQHYENDYGFNLGKSWILPYSYYVNSKLNQFRLDKLNERIRDLKEAEDDKGKI